MSSSNNSSASGSIGFAGLLTIVFIVLRLWPDGHGHHIINWSWWWVLAPIWISWAIALVIIAIVLLAALVLSRN